jgi:cytochrome c5
MLKRTTLLSLLLLALLAACNKQEPAAPSPQSATPSATASEYAPPTAATDTPEPGAAKVAQANDTGKTVYDKTCMVCHAAGVAGAPKFGDKALWAPRIAQGIDKLYENSIKGFKGKTGVMPPKGGNMSLSDADMKAAVDYMVAHAR